MASTTRPSLQRALAPVIKLLDRSGRAAHQRPSAYEEGTRFPEFPWDLRTIIIVFPEEAPFRFLNLNILLGLTGVPFDQVERYKGKPPLDAFDLQFCLEAKDRYATYKQYHSIARELNYGPGEVYFQLGQRLKFSGNWPDYQVHYRQPEQELELEMELASWPEFHWWAYFPNMYYHYTGFSSAAIKWRWNDDQGSVSVSALHDHGWGKNTLPLRLPLKVFRYEVLQLPKGHFPGAGGFALSLWTEAPGGIQIKNVGLFRDQKQSQFMNDYQCQVLEWDTFDNYAGRVCRVPRRWRGTQRGPAGEFAYEAARSSEPRAVLGEGFLYGFDYQGRLSMHSSTEKVEGRGYVEQLGRFLS